MRHAVAILVAILLWPLPATGAGPLTIRVCELGSPTFKRDGGNLLVICPGKTEPTLTVAGCVGPKVTRLGQDYTITCASWRQFSLVSKP